MKQVGDPIRVGVLLDSLSTAPAYVRRILCDIVSAPGLELILAIGNGAPKPSARPWWKRLTSLRGKGWVLYWMMDSRYHILDDPTNHVDISPLLFAADCFTATPLQTKFVDRFDQRTIHKIKKVCHPADAK